MVGILVSLAAPPACVEIEPEQTGQAIGGGTVSPTDSAVVALVAGDEQFCTGSLIAANIVLTAAHCLPPNAPYALEEIEIFTGPDVTQGGERIAVASGLAHPEWADDTLPNDVGLVALATPQAIEPLRILADVSTELIDTSVRVVGYGVTSDNGDENGVKRSGRMTVDEIDASTIFLSQGPALTCNGDSGGPLLVETPAGELLAGIHSRSDCESISLAERIDRHLVGLIGEFMLEFGAEASCSADGLCTQGCEVPDTDCGDPIDSACESEGECDGEVVGGCSAGGAPNVFGLLLLAFFLAAARVRSSSFRERTN